MPRKGWSQMDGCPQRVGADPPRSAPKGSPVAESILIASSSAGSAGPEALCGVAPLQLPSRSPVTVAVEAVAEVKQLQAAIGVLGENSVARNKAKLPPIQEQLKSCKTFLERVRKRVLRAQAVIDRANEQKAVYKSEVADGQRRLEALQVEAAQMPAPRVAQEKIDTLVRERDALRSRADQPGVSKYSDKWMGEGPPCFENIPPMPSTNVQELEGWISDRNCELLNAVEFGDVSSVAKIGVLVG